MEVVKNLIQIQLLLKLNSGGIGIHTSLRNYSNTTLVKVK